MKDSSKVFTKITELSEYLELPITEEIDFSPDFPFRVPLSYAQKMQKGNLNDPLLLQVLPTKAEHLSAPGFTDDPVGDLNSVQDVGILQKYKGRILLLASPVCSARCRFCFRRNEAATVDSLLPERVAAYLKNHPDISEVIFSGGDPFVNAPEHLNRFLENIAPAESVRTLRFHTRVPITEPTLALKQLQILLPYTKRFRLVVVLHTNHAQELTGDTPNVLAAFRNVGITLLNQSVLLRHINDNAQTLAALSETLFTNGVLPYYLHVLDKAQGTSHFEVPDAEAKQIHRELLTLLPGYLVPRLVREIAGEKSKTPLF